MDGKYKILLIDDDLYTCDMYAHSLKLGGYSVTIVHDGNEGYEQLRTGNYDLVLLDLVLPRKMGTRIIEEWREHHPRKTRPSIVVITNYEQDDAGRQYIENEVDAYIVKAGTPPRKLRELIAKILNN